MTQPLSIGAISYVLGEPQDLNTLKERGDAELLSTAKRAGIRRFAVSKHDTTKQAAEVAAQVLAKSRVDASRVGAVILVHTSPPESFETGEGFFGATATELGLFRAMPIPILAGACPDVTTSLRIAAGLIRGGEVDHALVIYAGRVGSDKDRLMETGLGVVSDAAVGFMVSPAGIGEFNLLHHDQTNKAVNAELNRSQPIDPCAAQIAKISLERAGLRQSDFERVLVNNYVPPVAKGLVELAGFDAEIGYYDNIERFGHSIAGDSLINLVDMVENNRFKEGSKFVIIESGPCAVSSAILEYAP